MFHYMSLNIAALQDQLYADTHWSKIILEEVPDDENATPVLQKRQIPKVGLKLIYLALEN